jgi:glycosyltransferase involved in cell wall biosynthesis
MSLLEAFSNNCPVCLSNSSCFPEIAADAGIYFDPYDSDSIYETIAKVIYDNEFSNRLRQAGQRRLLSFSWKKCAMETALSYKKVFN